MKAADYYQNGDPSVLRYEDVPDPVRPAQGVLIKVAAVSVEGGDILNRFRGALVTKSHILGYLAACEIIEVGPEVTHLRVGQKVATVNMFGSHAELRAVQARTAWVIPDGFDPRKASVIPVAFGTADDCLFEFGRLKAGETVLIQAGASGVGIAAIQLAKRAGATVLATASSDERLERLKPYGLDHGINYKTEDVVQAVYRLTKQSRRRSGGRSGRRRHRCRAACCSLGYRGRVSMVGQAGREPMQVDVSSMMAGNRSLSGVFLGAEIATDRVHNNIQRLIDEAARGEFEVVIDRTLPAGRGRGGARLHRKPPGGGSGAADPVRRGQVRCRRRRGGEFSRGMKPLPSTGGIITVRDFLDIDHPRLARRLFRRPFRLLRPQGRGVGGGLALADGTDDLGQADTIGPAFEHHPGAADGDDQDHQPDRPGHEEVW